MYSVGGVYHARSNRVLNRGVPIHIISRIGGDGIGWCILLRMRTLMSTQVPSSEVLEYWIASVLALDLQTICRALPSSRCPCPRKQIPEHQLVCLVCLFNYWPNKDVRENVLRVRSKISRQVAFMLQKGDDPFVEREIVSLTVGRWEA